MTTIADVVSLAREGQNILFNIRGKARVQLTILTADLVRVQIAPQGAFKSNVSRAVVKTDWPAAEFEVSETRDQVIIATSVMQLIVRKKPFVLECRDLSGKLIVGDDPKRRIRWDNGRTEVFKTTQPGEKYIGLGWRPQRLVRNGRKFVMRNRSSYEPPETFNAEVPLWYGLRRGRAYAIFFDDTSWGTIDVGASSRRYMSFRNLGGNLDYYIFAGPTMAGILDRFTELTGRPFMPPRWAVGYQQCRWSYTPQSQLLEIAGEFRRRKIPCDCLYLDIDYMPNGHALTFDPKTFPKPVALLRRLHGQGFRVIANISPLLVRSDPKFGQALRRGLFLKTARGKVLIGRHFYWKEFRGDKTGECAWLDFTRTAVREWWAHRHRAFLRTGVDGIWNDLNEPEEMGKDWPSDVKYGFDGRPVDHCRTSPQYSLIQAEMSCDILRKHRPRQRPYVISRGGYAGIQRCAALWTGDNKSGWVNDFKRNIPMGLSMSICGNPHNGHDIGGFFGQPKHEDPIDPELYVRWMQAGVFNPFCRQHHDGFGNNPRMPRPFTEPWRFGPEIEAICRRFIEMRYRLMPYLYTLFHNAHQTGEPVQRPTFWDFPQDPLTLRHDYDFMFGPFMLVSPVTRPGASTWDTYLPAGTQWINWWDESVYPGGRTVTTKTPLDRLPIFVRAGAIIPTGPFSQYEGQQPLDTLTLDAYPSANPSSFTLYEDDGISWDYLKGGYCKTHYQMRGTGDAFATGIGARQGSFVPTPRKYLLKIHRWPGSTLAPRLNGKRLPGYATRAALDAAESGYFIDSVASIMQIKFADNGLAMSVTLRPSASTAAQTQPAGC
ncbi:MAG: glycoside hydrolase family 31 protein [Phycisphaerae bacterium]|nr:glycoside hydrolase family 31 protein [Phycisphaerae bacterium]